MASKEMFCAASVTPMMTPVSCCGSSPFGMMTYNQTVPTSVAMATSSVNFWCASTHFKPCS